MRSSLFIISLIASVLGMLLLMNILGRHPPGKIFRGNRELSGMLKKGSSRIYGIQKIDAFMQKYGATFHYGKKITTEKLMVVSGLLFLVAVIVGYRINIVLCFVFGLIIGSLPWVMLPILNKKDNENMLPDLKMVYTALAMQIKAGVYVTDALSECYTSVKDRRLRDALLDVGSDVVMKSDLFGALEKFQAKFDNRYIDSLCITILQSLESGQATQLLSDLADQVRDMEKSVLEKKKGRLDRSLTFYQLGMLACVLAVALYACVNYMLVAAINM